MRNIFLIRRVEDNALARILEKGGHIITGVSIPYRAIIRVDKARRSLMTKRFSKLKNIKKSMV